MVVTAGAAIVAIALGSVAAFGGDTMIAGSAVPGVATTFDVVGSFTLIDDPIDGSDPWYTGSACEGEGGFSDIGAGATVNIRRDGVLVRQGALAKGTASSSTQCDFTISVADVPSGNAVYTWEVADRGELILDVQPGQTALAFGQLGG